MLETILLLEKENYQKLKWLMGFIAGNKKFGYDSVWEYVYVLGASLVTTDGISMGRIDIPDVLKEFCSSLTAFNIIKLTTNPYLAIVEKVKVENDIHAERIKDRSEAIAKFIDLSKHTTEPANRVFSVSTEMMKKLSAMPSEEGAHAGRLTFYTTEPQKVIGVTSRNGFSLIMPMFHPDDEKFLKSSKAKLKLSKEGKELVESAGVEVKKEARK